MSFYPTKDQMRLRLRALVNKLASDAAELRHVPTMKRDETVAFVDGIIAHALPLDEVGLQEFAHQFVDTFIHLHEVDVGLDEDTVMATLRAMVPGRE